MKTTSLPLVITLGDPCGIGPEIAAKAWTQLNGRSDRSLAFCVIGDAQLIAAQGVPVVRVTDVAETAKLFQTALPVLDHPLNASVIPGVPNRAHAQHIINWIKTGVDLCQGGHARALVTCPIAKSVLYATGFTFPGHTEYLATLCAFEGIVPQPVMMLSAKDLRVVLATIHIPMNSVAAALTTDHLVTLGRITHHALIRDFGIASPRLVMAALNPHAGEDGTIGREEIDILRPAVAKLTGEAINILGPYPADTLFHDEARSRFDVAICMYHDQGLIPLKTIDFWGGVNVTLGLPIVRTSPDHGTGFNIAGQNLARADSLLAAIQVAHTISRNRIGV